MKWNDFNKNDVLLFIEFAAVTAFLLLPPLFSAVPFTLPPKPDGLYAQCVFCFYTICAAVYEEILYRLYTPNRLHRIYAGYIEPRLQGNVPASENGSEGTTENAIDLQQRSLSHNQHSRRGMLALSLHTDQSRYKKAASFKTTVLFELCFAEIPALLLFTLAHRYLGGMSVLFAAGAGIVFRIAYLKLKQVFHPAVSIALVAIVHGLWNIGVYYYLWGNTGTRVISRLYGLSANAISFTFSELYTAIFLA
ncbi:CPBP family intramembrane metalloprotease [Treponema vincentii]|uniref:CPBP family intramembrane metalloprotease n=1 Tax=Treponema vincentii TaxID=69710 RepID=A0A6P1XYB5_9SPIR|nr:CPBP family intramembrane glutamic endopeptidase [Treponema vincentii]QHX42498.1 CPBP family intramembrane metalloprotease [Treponema vincentii]